MAERNPDQKRKDPELQRQLEAARAAHTSVQAVFMLKGADQPTRSTSGSPEDTRRTVRDLLDRAEQLAGEHVVDWNVFPLLGSFVVVASPRIVEAVLAQDEVASASANRRPTG